MIPRITKMSIQQSHSLTKTLANNMNIQLILTIPMVFGLIAIMPSFYLWFFGEEFASTVPLMTILAILVLIIPLNMLISRQYLLIVNKIRLYNASITIGAVINLVLCIILIYFYGIYGAAIARLITEFFLLIWRFIDITKINVKLNIVSTIQCVIAAVMMFIVLELWSIIICPYNVRYAAINCDWYSSLSFINDDYEKSIRMANIEASST